MPSVGFLGKIVPTQKATQRSYSIEIGREGIFENPEVKSHPTFGRELK